MVGRRALGGHAPGWPLAGFLVPSWQQGTTVGQHCARRMRALSSCGIWCLGIAAFAWGMVMQVGAWTYSYSEKDYKWDNARNYCQTFFTDLVAIQNKEEIEYLNRTLPYHNKYYWIGIRKLGGTWTWVGTKKELTEDAVNWATGEPNNRQFNQDCVEIYIKRQPEAGKWNDEPCTKKKKALCYKASCQPLLCGLHGDCMEVIQSYKCKCHPGFTGENCENAVTCPVLTPPEHGELNCSHLHGSFAFGSICDFSCQPGFVMFGPQSRECTATGTWTGDTLQCQAISCPVLDAPSHGHLNCSHLYGNFTFNSTCTFSCKDGFIQMGAGMLRCAATGNWTRYPPVCEEDSAAFLKQVLVYTSTSALAVAGLVLSGTLIALLAKQLSNREEKKKLLNPTSDLGAPGLFTNAAYDSTL
ncbi:L-selectin-like isoform X2 [Numida meleagris]|uniref:L-selectin-like isoform X2 n=1 Tax=Numida meleagris TaxID=8996 RepID=UPI000B3D92E7|nr:L-selectin-like isoform X2 [Numida meleagris]